MKLRANKLHIRLIDTALYWTSFRRFKHWRGRGIHSPFTYDLIRNALMCKDCDREGELYLELRRLGLRERYARQLQNLHNYCEYRDFTVLDRGILNSADGRIVVIPHGSNRRSVEEYFRSREFVRSATVMLYPSLGFGWRRFCQRQQNNGRCMTIDNRGYILFFPDRNLPVQNFKL